MRMIFVNLPVKNLTVSWAFFDVLRFTFNPKFSTEDAACMIVADNIFVMLRVERRFRDFTIGPISRANTATEVLTCLSVESRDAVDTMLAQALAGDGRPWKPVMDHGFMYECSFQDPDEHVWRWSTWTPPPTAKASRTNFVSLRSARGESRQRPRHDF